MERGGCDAINERNTGVNQHLDAPVDDEDLKENMRWIGFDGWI